MTPLLSDALLDAGTAFQRPELKRRILSHFWRDCCLPACFSRAPSPVVELSASPSNHGAPSRRLAAWWLLPDGIMEDDLGPTSDRLLPFFGGVGRIGQLWPRYEFAIADGNATAADRRFTVELTIYAEPMVRRRQRIVLSTEADERVKIVEWQISPKA